jgi:hypothetical protein
MAPAFLMTTKIVNDQRTRGMRTVSISPSGLFNGNDNDFNPPV